MKSPLDKKRRAAVYLAGPDVFLPDAVEVGQRKKELCDRYDFEGLFPMDNEVKGADVAGLIFEANVAMIKRCDAVIANLTPFRGVSADVGTVFEVGYAHALKKPILGYTNVPGSLRERVSTFLGSSGTVTGADGRLYASDKLALENFSLADNLMITEAIRASGHDVVMPPAPVADVWRDLRLFEECLKQLAKVRRPREAANA